MAATSASNPDLPRQQSPCSSSLLLPAFVDLHTQQDQSQIHCNPAQAAAAAAAAADVGVSNMDDLLKNIYASPAPPSFPGGPSISRDGSFSLSKEAASKSVDEVWKEIVAGGEQGRAGAAGIEGMTLEDFLTKAGAVREEDVSHASGVGVPVPVPYAVIGNPSNTHNNNNHNDNNHSNNSNGQHQHQGYGNGMAVETAGRGRGKRRLVEEPPVDKATQQKQRRMIKNRESAARSRERKQAYTVELESLVTQLEEENARLLREEAEQNKERLKQLMDNLIPVVEKGRPPRVLRRVHSVQW